MATSQPRARQVSYNPVFDPKWPLSPEPTTSPQRGLYLPKWPMAFAVRGPTVQAQDGRIVGMGSLGIPELVFVLALALVLFGPQKLPDLGTKLAEAINRFRGGGPGSPTHPIPANDSPVLNRRRQPPAES